LRRILITNADDFGFTRDVNTGIVEAHTQGILTATTLMANGAAYDDAVALARQHPSLDIGCHLVLVGGESLAHPGTKLPDSVPALLAAVTRGQVQPYEELRPQVERILASGVGPTHLDTHKHTHLFPPITQAVARLSQEFAIPWVRAPFDAAGLPVRAPWAVRATSAGIGFARPGFMETLARHGCRSTRAFFGFQITGRYGAAELAALIAHLPEGTTEFMCHPGRLTNELRAAPTRLKESRQAELDALTAPPVRRALEAAGVVLSSYRALPSTP
jgi:chitin disaccharide deacetylase